LSTVASCVGGGGEAWRLLRPGRSAAATAASRWRRRRRRRWTQTANAHATKTTGSARPKEATSRSGWTLVAAVSELPRPVHPLRGAADPARARGGGGGGGGLAPGRDGRRRPEPAPMRESRSVSQSRPTNPAGHLQQHPPTSAQKPPLKVTSFTPPL